MSAPSVRQPSLVATGSSDVRLHARRCECGYVFHPPHPYGCESCGRPESATRAITLDAVGALTAIAEVHVHPTLKSPFALGRVTLDRGPSVEVWLTGAARLSIGSRVRGKLVTGHDSSGAEVLDCIFCLDEVGA